MSKEDKHNKKISATEQKQAPVTSTITKLKDTKSKSPPKKSKHKHNYKITKMNLILRNGSYKPYQDHTIEYFHIDYICNIEGCNKKKTDFLLLNEDTFNEKYKDIYEELYKTEINY